jgi:hypothetical protein
MPPFDWAELPLIVSFHVSVNETYVPAFRRITFLVSK